MRLPMQAVPVQRAIVAFSRPGIDSRDAGLSGLYSTGNGVVASVEFGMKPSWGIFEDFPTGIAPILHPIAPILRQL